MLEIEGAPDLGPVGRLGLGLWHSPLRSLPCPPWAPRRDYASLSGGKAGTTGWRNIWVLGGDAGGGHYLNDIWRTTDGAATWEVVKCGPHWSPRSRHGCTGGQTASARPIGVMYVVGGHGNSGFLADVWASDTAGRTWHKMNGKAPFGPRAAPACAVVSGEPLILAVGGGVSVDMHRDLWLSRDGGETFGRVAVPGDLGAPPGCCLAPWPPEMLCATRTRAPGKLRLWRLKLGAGHKPGQPAAMEELEQEDMDEHLLDELPRPPRITLDLQAQVALSWNSKANCLTVHPLGDDSSPGLFGPASVGAVDLPEVGAVGAGEAHVHCDMDSAFAPHWHGRLWVFSQDGTRVWATDRGRLRAQSRFLKLLGVRVSNDLNLPVEVWGKVRAFLLPGPRRVMAGEGAQAALAHGPP